MLHKEENQQPSIYSFFFFQALVAVFLVVGLLNRQRDLTLLTLLILVIMAGARLWSRVSLRNLFVGISVDRPRLFPDEQLQVDVSIKNRKWLPVRLRLEMSVEDGRQFGVDNVEFRRECGLLWYQKTNMQWRHRLHRRGVYHLAPSRTTAGDLFGFFFAEQRTERTPIEIVVYPRLMPLKPFAFPKKNVFGVPGAKSPVQDPIYLLGTRDYQHWQPARYIHWKASARRNRLQQKIFEPSSQAKIFLLIDTASFAEHDARDDFEQTLEAAASITLQCDHHGYALGFMTNGVVIGGRTRIPISQGSKSLIAVLDMLARLRMEALRPLRDDLLNDRSIHSGASVICFSYENNAETKAVEQIFKHRKIPVVTIVCRGPVVSETGATSDRDTVIILGEMAMGTTSS